VLLGSLRVKAACKTLVKSTAVFVRAMQIITYQKEKKYFKNGSKLATSCPKKCFFKEFFP